MSWVKIEDATTVHRKVRFVGRPAFALWVAGLCYATRFRTNGRIPKAELDVVWTWPDDRLEADAALLVAVGMWEDKGDYWLVHDFLEYQESAKELDRKRKLAAARMKRHRETKMQRVSALVHETLAYGAERSGDLTTDPTPKIDPTEDPDSKRNAKPEQVDRCWNAYQDAREQLGLRRLNGILIAPKFEALLATAIHELGDVDAVVDGINASAARAKEQKPKAGEFSWRSNFVPETVFKAKNLTTAVDWARSGRIPDDPSPPYHRRKL